MEAAAWLALAYRSALPTSEMLRVALEGGPDPDAFPPDVLEREARDVAALDDLGVRLVPIGSPEYPLRLRAAGPVVLQVAGRVSLLSEPGVTVATKFRGEPGRMLVETLESGGNAVLVLSKGMLKATSLLRGMQHYLDNGAIAVVSAEPPRAAWGPVRDARRDVLAARLADPD
ncbi:MAG: hypothetical protein OER88_08450 [Planctomycetota bacterium]|nr:hypothetical protein [Planctomycetota bacterium]